MMSLQELWKNSGEEDADLSALIKPGLSKLRSRDPLIKIKRNLLIGTILGLLIAVFYVWVMIIFPVWQVLSTIGIVFLFTVWASYRSYVLYREINASRPDNSLLQELESNYSKIKGWIRNQQRVGLLIYPVSATGGFMIGGSAGAGKSITEVMQKPVMLIALGIVLVILVPLCHYLTKWITKKAFSKHSDQLKKNIDSLKSGS